MANDLLSSSDEELLLSMGINPKSVESVTYGIKSVSKAIDDISKSIDKLNSKTLNLTSLSKSKEYQKAQYELKKAQLTLDNKINNNAKMQNLIARFNTKEQTAQLRLSTKKNNSLSKSKTYLKALVEYQKSIKTKQESVNKALKDAGIKINSNSSGMSKWLKNTGKMAISFLSLRTLGNIVGSVTQKAGAWTENLNLFNVSFGKMSEKTLDWALDYAKQLGVSNNEIVKMLGLFRQLSESIGLSDYNANELSETLTKLTYDFASYYNIVDIQSVADKLQSGIFSGQIKSLRAFGIDVSQTRINEFLKSSEALKELGLDVTATQLTQAQKAIARTIITMQSGENAFGDMGRTIDTLANRIRVLQGSWENLQTSFGIAIQDVAGEVIAYIIGIIQAVTEVINSFIPKTKSSLNETEKSSEDTTESIKNAEDAIEDFSQTANNLSFDKFETLTSSESENLSITSALTKELEKQNEEYDKTLSKMMRVDETVQKVREGILDFVFPNRTEEQLGEMNPLLINIKDLIVTTFEFIKTNLPKIMDLMSSLMEMTSNLATILLPVITSLLVVLAPIVKMLVSLLNQAVATTMIVLTPIAYLIEFIVRALSALLQGLKDVLTLNWTDVEDRMAEKFKGRWISADWAVSSWDYTKSAFGFANGGIPNKSELFYMNENGVPEALINTGGSQTNVVNMQQLRQMTKEGFIEAIRETGLGNGFTMTIEGRNIDNSSIARGIFPALKVESKRQGGNQL